MVVYSTPSAYSSAHDDLIYTVYDAHSVDPVGYPNYKYIADIYVNSNLVARLKKIQDPTTNVGVFNVGPTVRNYLATTFNPTSGIYCQNLASGEFYVNVLVKFGEEYNFTNYLSIVSASTVKVYNSYNTDLGVQALTSKVNKIASNRPLTGEVLLTSAYYFVPYFLVSGVVTVTVDGVVFFYSPPTFTLQMLNISPVAINAAHPGLITADTKTYSVAINSQTIIMSVVCEQLYTPYTLHFLNRYGGFESKIFQKLSRKNFEVTRKDFGKLPYTVNGSGVVSYKKGLVYNEQRSVYASTWKESLTLNSDFLTDAEYVWLEDLLISPMVFLEDVSFYPVVLTDNNYEAKQSVNDELSNLTLSIEYQTKNAQYR
jgi:hypothetical protein